MRGGLASVNTYPNKAFFLILHFFASEINASKNSSHEGTKEVKLSERVCYFVVQILYQELWNF